MKKKFLLGALMIGCAFTAWADGYTDGIEYYKAGQYANARTVLTNTLNDAGTNKAMSYYYLGCLDLVDKNLASAKANFEKGIAVNAECPYNYVGLGAIDLRNGNTKAAEDQFKTAQKLGKKNHEITVDIARAYYNADPVKYAEQVEKYLQKAHKDSKNTEPSIYILEGDRLFDQKELGNAAAKYEQAITFDQDNPEGYVKYAAAYMGVNPAYGIAKLEELLQKQPTSALAQRELAERYYEVNQWTKAAEQYGKYMANPNHFPEDKARYLVLIYASEDYPKAIQIADELLAIQPQNAQALRVKGLSQYEAGQYQAAIDTYNKFMAVPNAPVNAKDYTTIAQSYEKLENMPEAIVYYQKAVDVDPTRADSYKNLSGAYMNIEDYQNAADVYSKLIDVNPETSLNDYLTLSARWLNAANQADQNGNIELCSQDAEKGIAAIDKVIEGASELSPSFLQRKALLTFFADNRNVTDRVADAYMALITELDKDPVNADASSPNNHLSWYKQGYQMLTKYYLDKGDNATSDLYFEKFNAIQ